MVLQLSNAFQNDNTVIDCNWRYTTSFNSVRDQWDFTAAVSQWAVTGIAKYHVAELACGAITVPKERARNNLSK